jgi:hypothetical protein
MIHVVFCLFVIVSIPVSQIEGFTCRSIIIHRLTMRVHLHLAYLSSLLSLLVVGFATGTSQVPSRSTASSVGGGSYYDDYYGSINGIAAAASCRRSSPRRRSLQLLPLRGGGGLLQKLQSSNTTPREGAAPARIRSSSTSTSTSTTTRPSAAVGTASGSHSSIIGHWKTQFWSWGVLEVHDHYLRLFWEVTKGSVYVLVAVLLTLGLSAFPTEEVPKEFLEGWLMRIQASISHVTLVPLVLYAKSQGMSSSITFYGDYHQAFQEMGLPLWLSVVTRPIVDGIVFRWAIKAIWDGCTRLAGKHKKEKASSSSSSSSLGKSLRWSVLSSILYGISHIGTSLPPPSPEYLQSQVELVLQEGYLTVFGMTFYRQHWNAALVEELLHTQPLLLAIGRGVVHAVLSWGLLCPLYQLQGLLASIGAQFTWLIFSLRHVDTQILLRVFSRIFLPWSTNATSTSDGTNPSSARGTRFIKKD